MEHELQSTDLRPAAALDAIGYRRAAAHENVLGWLGSLLLHVLFAILFLAMVRSSSQTAPPLAKLIPINIVQLGENTASAPQRLKAAVPLQKAPVRRNAHHSIPAANAPARIFSPRDAMDAQLRTLAKMRETETNLPVLDNAGSSNVDATSNDAAAGAFGTYSIRDYIRNQVERRWNFNVSRLRGRNYVVELHIELRKNGVIDKAEIVDRTRYTTDAAWRDVALSARNAVLLSSPIALPRGELAAPMQIMLRLNPRDTLR